MVFITFPLGLIMFFLGVFSLNPLLCIIGACMLFCGTGAKVEPYPQTDHQFYDTVQNDESDYSAYNYCDPEKV